MTDMFAIFVTMFCFHCVFMYFMVKMIIEKMLPPEQSMSDDQLGHAIAQELATMGSEQDQEATVEPA